MPDLFPYPPRPGQAGIVRLVRETVRNGGDAVIESGTGTGKTAVSLAGALEGVAGTGRKVIYLTRTKSQQRQVAVEAKAIGARAPVILVAIQGRSPATCPLMTDDPSLADGTAEELSKLCSELKKGTGPAGQCPYFEALGSVESEQTLAYLKGEHPEPEEFFVYCKERGICPYETVKRLLPYADAVAATYAFFFEPNVLRHFLGWLNIQLKDAVVIVDEAHNLPDYLREVNTCRYSARTLELVAAEAGRLGNPEIAQGLTVTDFVQVIQDIIGAAQDKFLHGDDGFLPPDYLNEELMDRLGLSTTGITAAVKGLAECGESVAAAAEAKRRLPRSHIGALARFLTAWNACDENTHVFLIIGGRNPALESFCLDPWEVAQPLRECRASVHLSGTLAPLEDYARELGLDQADCEIFPSPFPPDHLQVVYAEDVSTKFAELNGDPAAFERLRAETVAVCQAVRRNTAVFFPSYALMERFIDAGVPDELGRPVYYERAGMPQEDLMEQVAEFRMAAGGVLFAVSGGRVSEGLDFPGQDLEFAVLVGIPYARPSAKQDALIRYGQNRFGSGWEHAVKVPAVRKMRQAVGRLIRSETDRGMAVILDRRAATLEGLPAKPVSDPVAAVRSFFGAASRPPGP